MREPRARLVARAPDGVIDGEALFVGVEQAAVCRDATGARHVDEHLDLLGVQLDRRRQ